MLKRKPVFCSRTIGFILAFSKKQPNYVKNYPGKAVVLKQPKDMIRESWDGTTVLDWRRIMVLGGWSSENSFVKL